MKTLEIDLPQIGKPLYQLKPLRFCLICELASCFYPYIYLKNSEAI